MTRKDLMDISTLDADKRDPAPPAPGLIPVLTVVSHPTMDRVGSQLVLEGLAAGREVALSRHAPDFVRPGELFGLPLADPGLSRTRPLRLTPGALTGSVRVDAREGCRVIIPGEEPGGPWEFSAEQVAAGVVLELAERVVLLLHLSDPSEREPPDALGMVGTSLGLRQVRRHIKRVAGLEWPVLIRGESGSGKDEVARAIHQHSSRRHKPLVVVNMGTLTKELAASQLFGAVKGSFTGAVKDLPGFFRAAHGGTLFLDEIGEAPAEVQVMLLRVLETGEVIPVGEHTPLKVDVRLIAATDAPLEQLIEQGLFKEPLLHRLAGYQIRVPPLRERREDIGLLFLHFARKHLKALGEEHRLTPPDASSAPWLPSSLASRLVRGDWKGNIRQLSNLTRQLLISNQGQPSLKTDPDTDPFLAPASPSLPVAQEKSPSRSRPSDFTEAQLIEALRGHDFEFKAAAARLGVARSTFYDWFAQHPQVKQARQIPLEQFARQYRECDGNLGLLSRRLDLPDWVLERIARELGLWKKKG